MILGQTRTILARVHALGEESKALLDLIHKHGPITKLAMAQRCGFTTPSLKRYLKPLLDEGLVQASGTGASAGGRRPVLYTVCANEVYAVGINLASMYTEIRIVNFAVKLVAKRRFDDAIQQKPDQLLPRLAEAMEDMIRGCGLDREKIVGIGVSVFGAYDHEAGSIRRPFALFHHTDWIGYPLVQRPSCICGNYGCLECYSAIPAIMKSFLLEAKKGRGHSIARPLEEVTFYDVFQAADKGDALAAEVVSNAATMLGVALANYINLINPDIITMDSLIIRNSKLYYSVAVDVARRRSSFVNPDGKTRFIRDSSFEDAHTVGAAVMAMESILFDRQF